jgi:ABC-type multidrug transport system fused ATPase/permease subunit
LVVLLVPAFLRLSYLLVLRRLSTVRNSDCIMVLEQGRIIERGTIIRLENCSSIHPSF